jgi:hypothetical protein
MSGSPIKALPVVANQDRAFAAFSDSEVDGPGGARDQRDEGRLVAFADDAQHPMAPLEGHVLDIGPAGFAHA